MWQNVIYKPEAEVRQYQNSFNADTFSFKYDKGSDIRLCQKGNSVDYLLFCNTW